MLQSNIVMLEGIILALVCGIYILLAIIVTMNDKVTLLNRVFTGLLIITPLWCTVVYLENLPVAPSTMELLVRFDYALVSALIGLFYWFCVLLSQRRWFLLTATVCLLSIAASLVSIIGGMTRVVIAADTVVLQPILPSYWLFIALLVISIGGGVGALSRRYATTRGRERTQVVIISTGLLLTVAILSTTLVIMPQLFNISDASLTRLGLYGIIFFAGFSVYALVRHQFLDIQQAVARSFAYALMMISLTVLYIALVFTIVRLFFRDQELAAGPVAAFTVAAVVITFSHEALKGFFDRVTNRIFYRQAYDFQTVLKNIGDITSNHIELREIVHKTMATIQQALRADFVTTRVISLPPKQHEYNFYAGKSVKYDNALLSVLETYSEDMISLYKLSSTDPLAKEMRRLRIHVIVRLVASRQVLGYVSFGNKQNGSRFNARDLALLDTIKNELELSIQNSLRFKEIEDFNETLQAKIHAATEELRHTNRKLRELDTTKDEFLSMTSHQLRTPLTSIKGYLSMVLDGDLGKLNAEQQRALKEAYDSSQRMVYLIADFLNLSRLQTGRFELEITPTSLPSLIKEEIMQMQASASTRGVVLMYEPPIDFPSLTVDENKIRQVMMNFIDNAIYYAKPEGGHVTISLDKHSHHIAFRVTDNGIGVPKYQRHRLFTKFYRADNARSARPDGTGIGLFMAKKVITAHGGSIIFESKENEGSTFGFRLPLDNARNGAQHPDDKGKDQ